MSLWEIAWGGLGRWECFQVLSTLHVPYLTTWSMEKRQLAVWTADNWLHRQWRRREIVAIASLCVCT